MNLLIQSITQLHKHYHERNGRGGTWMQAAEQMGRLQSSEMTKKKKKKSGSWSSVFFAAHSQRFRSPLQVTATSNQPTKAINAATSKAFASSDTSWKQIIDSSYVPPRNPYLDAEEFLVLPITIATLQFGFPAP